MNIRTKAKNACGFQRGFDLQPAGRNKLISLDHCCTAPDSVARGTRSGAAGGPVVPWSHLASFFLALSFLFGVHAPLS